MRYTAHGAKYSGRYTYCNCFGFWFYVSYVSNTISNSNGSIFLGSFLLLIVFLIVLDYVTFRAEYISNYQVVDVPATPTPFAALMTHIEGQYFSQWKITFYRLK